MSFFIVQVQTNYEKYVLHVLANILLERKGNPVKSIYALETKIDFEQSVNPDDIRDYLKQTRLRNYLNNMRYAYSQINSNDNLKQSYKKQIRDLGSEIKRNSAKNKKKKETSFIRGYIIIETTTNDNQIPTDVYHDLKSIPKVISIPSINKVPEDEIAFYFQQVQIQDIEVG